MILNRTKMAGAMGISKPALDSLIEEGCPYITKGAKGVPWEFESSEVLDWYIKRNVEKRKLKEGSGSNAFKLRKLIADTKLAEYHAEQAKKEVATYEEVNRQYSAAVLDIKTRLRQIPGKAAPKILGLKTEKDIKAVVLSVIDEVLMEIAEKA